MSKKTNHLLTLLATCTLLALPAGTALAADTAPADEVQSTADTMAEAPAAAAEPMAKPEKKPKNDSTMKVYWKSGLRLDSADERFKLKIGGRIQNDWAWFSDNGLGSEDGTEFRRARMYMSGLVYKNVLYKFQYDFVSSSPIKDAYIGVKNVPVLGTVTVGHFKEPFSIGQLTSSKYIAFMERGLADSLVPGRNTGIQVSNSFADKRVFAAAGLFRDSDGFGEGVGRKNYAATGRIAGLAVNNDDTLVHLGAALSYRKVDDLVSYSVRPEAHLAAKYLKSGDIDTTNKVLFNGEVAVVHGAAHLSAEYIGAHHDGPLTDVTLGGMTAQVGFFLTGESRAYKKGSFSRVKPENNFLVDGGAGAWEVVARVSQIDFTDIGGGGKLLDISAGLNWYLNPNTRVMLNYVIADLDGADLGHIAQTRFQIDF